MYSIMLVEDESAVREGIVKKIKWHEHGFELSGAYENGKLASEALKQKHADVVITDINMPVMDGLALARFISETSPQTIVVILTGFGDFSYAQTAIRCKVHEYILKPVTAKQLRELLDKLCAELDSRLAGTVDAGYDELRQGVMRSVRKFNHTVALETLDTLIERLLSGGLAQNECRLHLQKLALLLTDYTHEQKLVLPDSESGGSDILEQLSQKSTLADARVFLREYLSAVIEAGLEHGDTSGRQAALAVDYIKKNYGNPELSLQKITTYLSVSTSYFSSIFKQHTGVTFIDFLTRLRMHQAQELLVTTDMKNYEIADKVGYDDPGYFSSTFKKFTGMKPSEYRRQNDRSGGPALEES